MIKVIEYHFVSSHELSKCVEGNNFEIWISHKGTKTFCKFFFVGCWNLRKQHNVTDSNKKGVIQYHCVMISSDKSKHSRILYGFKTCLIVWPPCFVRHFLQTTMKSFWTLLQISKGEVFSFLRLCLYVCTSFKVNVIEGRLFLGFDNALTFALYSKMFPPFTIYTPFATFLNGGYNFSLKGFLSKSITLSHPFF